jgi:hypothetical protein
VNGDRGKKGSFGVRLTRDSPWQRLVFGLILLGAGVVFWLDQVGTINARDYFVWWPLALIAMGVANLLERRWFAAAIWWVTGIYSLLPLMGYSRFPLWRILGLWPLMISFAGLTLVAQALRRSGGTPAFRAIAVMAGNNRRIASQNFQRGEAVAVMGGCEIDLSPARIAEEAVIDVLAVWGGIEIRVPTGWKIIGRVAPILGGYEDKTAGAPDGAPRLVIRGSAIMGGIEVRNAESAS